MSAEEAKAYGIVDHVVTSTRDAQKITGIAAA
jgi:ATP-dependent protease ClpP protease subunit